jgi:hypothetical protein
MEPKRQREITLAIVALLLAVTAYTAYRTLSNPEASGATSSAAPSSSNGKTAPARRADGNAVKSGAVEAPDVHLQALNEGRPKPNPGGRDLFRYRMKPPPPPPPPPRLPVGPQPPPPPPVPPPPPPIALKFIGVIDMPPPAKRVAVLSDGRGSPVYGHEGDTVLGQYRILRIGAESIEMSYLDGRGRQTIRLSGS